MIVSMDHTGKNKTIYKCDRCGHIIDTAFEEKYTLSVRTASNRKKQHISWDFCKRCYRALKRGIEKGPDRNKEVNENERSE